MNFTCDCVCIVLVWIVPVNVELIGIVGLTLAELELVKLELAELELAEVTTVVDVVLQSFSNLPRNHQPNSPLIVVKINIINQTIHE